MRKINQVGGIAALLFGLMFLAQANAISDNNGVGNLTVFPDVSDELSTHTQFINVTMFNNDLVNLSFTFNSSPLSTKVWQWQNYSHPTTQYNTTCLPYNYIDENNTIVEVPNCSTTTYTTDEYFFEWNDKSSLIQHDEVNGTYLYSFLNVPFTANELEQFKFRYNTQINSKGKWDLLVWQGNFENKTVLLEVDPWWNASWPYCRNIYLNQSTLQLQRINEPIVTVVDSSNWTHKPYSDSIRVVPDSCYGVHNKTDIPSDIFNITQIEEVMNGFSLVFLANTTGQNNITYSMYYDTAPMGLPDYSGVYNKTVSITANNVTMTSHETTFQTMLGWAACYKRQGIWLDSRADGGVCGTLDGGKSHAVGYYQDQPSGGDPWNLWGANANCTIAKDKNGKEINGAVMTTVTCTKTGGNAKNSEINYTMYAENDFTDEVYNSTSFGGSDSDAYTFGGYTGTGPGVFYKLATDGTISGSDTTSGAANRGSSGGWVAHGGQSGSILQAAFFDTAKLGYDGIWSNLGGSEMQTVVTGVNWIVPAAYFENASLKIRIYMHEHNATKINESYTKFRNPLGVAVGAEQLYETTPPTVTLISPANNTYSTNASQNFVFKPVGTEAYLASCELWTNETGAWGSIKANTSALINNAENTIFYTFPVNGTFVWNIKCLDTVGNSNFSAENWTITADTTTNYMDLNLNLLSHYLLSANLSNSFGYLAQNIIGTYWVKLAGDVMTGDLNMDSHTILNVVLAGALMTADLNMRGHSILNAVISNATITNSNLSGSFGYSAQNLIGEHWVNQSGDLMTGNLNMTDNKVQDYKGFPQPDYDSGWTNISKGEQIALQHNLGGNPDDYAVDLQFKDFIIGSEYPDDAYTRGLWHLNDVSGNVVDSSSYGNHGTNYNATRGVEGKFGTNAFQFDGTNDYVLIQNSASLNLSDDITVEAWVKGNAQNNRAIISKYDTAGKRSWFLGTGYYNNQKLEVLISQDGGTTNFKQYESSITVFDNDWHHVVFTFNNSVLSLYIDGQLDTVPNKIVDASISTIYKSTTNVVLASYYASGSLSTFFDGIIDEVRISGTARTDFSTADENKTVIHNRGFGGASVSVGAWYTDLNTTSITVARGTADDKADQIRIRMWEYS